jgi:hypothetical protein
MEKVRVIHLKWEQHPWNDDVFTKFYEKDHYGIYQVYGDHPVYGEDCLLYIGRTNRQSYSVRLKQHNDFFASNIQRLTRFYISFFLATEDCAYEKWGELIDQVEQLLINAHSPAYNAMSLKGLVEEPNENIIIMNWGNRDAYYQKFQVLGIQINTG